MLPAFHQQQMNDGVQMHSVQVPAVGAGGGGGHPLSLPASQKRRHQMWFQMGLLRDHGMVASLITKKVMRILYGWDCFVPGEAQPHAQVYSAYYKIHKYRAPRGHGAEYRTPLGHGASESEAEERASYNALEDLMKENEGFFSVEKRAALLARLTTGGPNWAGGSPVIAPAVVEPAAMMEDVLVVEDDLMEEG